MVEVWGAKGSLTEAIYERSEWFALFLSNAKKGNCGSLVWTAASEMGGKHMGEGVEAVDGVRWSVRGSHWAGRGVLAIKSVKG